MLNREATVKGRAQVVEVVNGPSREGRQGKGEMNGVNDVGFQEQGPTLDSPLQGTTTSRCYMEG